MMVPRNQFLDGDLSDRTSLLHLLDNNDSEDNNEAHIIKHRVHTTSSLQKFITFYDYFSQKNYDFFMTSAIFLCRGLMFSNDVTH